MVTLGGCGNPAGSSSSRDRKGAPPVGLTATAPVGHSLSGGPGFAFGPNRDIFPTGHM
jgi:hypothetical protein